MRTNSFNCRRGIAALAAAALAVMTNASRASTVLFTDLTYAKGGSDVASGTTWLGGEFTTDTTTYSSLTADLLLSKLTATSTATLLLYSGTDNPTTMVGTFTMTSALTTSTTTTTDTTFAISGLKLATSTNYWIVLAAGTGSIDWSFSNDSDVSELSAYSMNGSSGPFFTSDYYDYLYSVTGSTPEPIGAAAGFLGLTLLGKRQRKQRRISLTIATLD